MTRITALKLSFFLLVLQLCLGGSLLAQVDRAVLEGIVTDATGSAISGAEVTIHAVDTGLDQQKHTNSNGYYRFPAVALGRYTVTVSNSSFKTKVVEGIVLQVGQTRTLDVQLEVGSVTEKVKIIASESPAERSSAEQATVIDTQQIANLPVNGRDWSALTIQAPFAQDDGGGNQRTIRFAGRAIDDNNFNIDGVDAGGIQEQAQKAQTRLQISPDAIAEYRVNSAMYDAQYGTQAGGQVDVVTKSGSNEFHGSAFGFLRNSVFDARNFNDFNTDAVTGNSVPVIPPFRLGQYGLAVGGPIVKDNTFFFLSYEGLRQSQSITYQPNVPTAQFLADVLVNGRGGNGPSPQMCSILQVYPWRASTGTLGGCVPRVVYPDSAFTPFNPADPNIEVFTHTATTTIHEDTWLIRVDHKFNDKTTLYGRAQRDIALSDAPNGALFDKVRIINHPANYFIALQHAFTPTAFNEAKVYINRSPFHNPNASVLDYAVSWPKSIALENLNNDNADIEVGTTYGFIDNFTWTRGRHALKAGMEVRFIRLNQGKTEDNNLTFGDPGLFSATVDNLTYNAPWCCHKYRRRFYMPYFQDEWKVTPNFTVNLGVRWDYYGVEYEYDNRTTVFDLNQFHGACLGSGSFNAAFPAPVNTPACPKNPSLYDPNHKNVDPRVSFAWAPGALQGKTVIRGGFGIYSGAAQNDDLNAGLESDTFRVSVGGGTPLTPALQQLVPDLTGIGTSKAANHPRALQRHGRLDQYVETWGLTIEHQLPAHFLLAGSYLGSHGVHLFSRGAVDLCSIPVTLNAAGNDCIRPLDQYFPDPANPNPYGSVDYKSDTGQSSYHGLLISLERRYSNGLSFQAHYAWSHSINDGAVGGGEANGQENVNCRSCDKGPSVFDIRHNFTANAVYELPFGPGKAFLQQEGVVGKMVGGWEISTIASWHTGHPLTVNLDLSSNITTGPFTGFASTYLLPDGNDQTSQRPDIVPGVPLYLTGGTQKGVPLLNPAAFTAPPVDANGNFTRFGNAGNGLLRALDIWQVDLAIMKDTKINERVAVQFGVQAFNVFNHVQYGDFGSLTLGYAPNTDSMGNPAGPPVIQVPGSFGIITSTVNGQGTNTGTGLPRQLQFTLRVKF